MRYESPAGTVGMEGRGDTTVVTVTDSPSVTVTTPPGESASFPTSVEEVVVMFATRRKRDGSCLLSKNG